MSTSLIDALKKEIDSKRQTVTAIARAANCSRQHIYGVISGKSEVTLAMAERLAGAIGMTLNLKKGKNSVK